MTLQTVLLSFPLNLRSRFAQFAYYTAVSKIWFPCCCCCCCFAKRLESDLVPIFMSHDFKHNTAIEGLLGISKVWNTCGNYVFHQNMCFLGQWWGSTNILGHVVIYY